MGQKRFVFIPQDSDEMIEKFINCLMLNGKKNVARKIFKDCLEIIGKRIKDRNAREVFDSAIRNVMPNVEVRPKRLGGAVYQIPREVKPSRQRTLAIRWTIQAARSKKGKPMCEKLANEIIDSVNDTGAAVKKKEDLKKMAKANKAFAHFGRF